MKKFFLLFSIYHGILFEVVKKKLSASHLRAKATWVNIQQEFIDSGIQNRYYMQKLWSG